MVYLAIPPQFPCDMQNAPKMRTRDALLDALVLLTRLHQRPFSAASLIAGLPLENGMMTPGLFVRAAERAGFNAANLQRDYDQINDLVLPVVLILKDGNCCILQKRNSETASVIFPDLPDEVNEILIETLLERYTGQCLYFKQEYTSDDANQPALDGHWFWSTIQKSRALYSEVIVASFMVNLFALVTPLFIMNVYDRVVPNQAIETLWVLASGVGIILIFDLVMKSLRGYFIDTASKRADILLSSKTFARVMNIKMSERPGRVGSFANNLQEFDTFREFFTSTTLIALIDLPFVILFILLIFSIGGSLALVPVIAIPAIIIIGVLFQKPLQEVITQTFSESAKKHAMLIETLTALDTVKGVRGEGVMQRRWEVFNARLARFAMRSRFLSLGAVNTTQAIQQLCTIGVVILGVYAIIDGNLSVGGLIACTILTGRCLAPMSQVASILTRYHHSVAAYKAIDNVMSLPVERPDGANFLHRHGITGDIEFRDVSFSYPGQSGNALKNVSFKINRGERVAIIGKTGSGKSTLQRLIMKFYEPVEGALLVGGTDVKQLDPNDLRGAISYVPQDAMLFNGTVRGEYRSGRTAQF